LREIDWIIQGSAGIAALYRRATGATLDGRLKDS